ncbi:hypothetical protein C0584_05420 [Candidatus Parcubacteria bacterium]|nr:MAG: hypothetical protein C0584_05420 [Candidatus Parcubacteria bacterium]
MKTKKKFLIIGFGRFGKLSASIFKKYFEVQIFDNNITTEKIKAAKIIGVNLINPKELNNADFIFLTVPISRTEETIKNISNKLKEGSLVMDACSVKTLPCKWLNKYLPKNVQILGTHPMFGPNTSHYNLEKQSWDLKNMQIVLCPQRVEPKTYKQIKDVFMDLGLKIIETTPSNHDKQNARTLSFVHFLGRSLWDAGFREQEIYTPGYKDILRIFGHTTNDDWRLFFDMNKFNPYSTGVRENFLKSCSKIENRLLKNESKDDFDYLRRRIVKIDKNIFSLLKERFSIATKIGKIKKRKGIKVLDKSREKTIIDKAIKESKLSPSFIKKIYRTILNQSYKQQ